MGKKSKQRIDQQQVDRINERLQSLIRRVADTTVPLCQPALRGEVMPAGSGLLLQIARQRYVLTASHVFSNAEPDRPIAAIIGQKFVTLRRDRRWRTAPRANTPDLADLAVASVDGDDEDTLPDARYMTLDEIDPFGVEVELAATTSFLALGYPRSKQPEAVRDGTYSAFAYHFLTHRESVKPGSIPGIDAEQHIVVGYDPQGFVGDPRVSNMPDPDGMSGGGLWRVPHATTSSDPRATLVGILIERRKKHRIIIASRIAEVLRFLRTLSAINVREIDTRFPALHAPAT